MGGDNDYTSSVSLSDDGTIAVVGSNMYHGGGARSGHVRIFQYNGTDNDSSG